MCSLTIEFSSQVCVYLLGLITCDSDCSVFPVFLSFAHKELKAVGQSPMVQTSMIYVQFVLVGVWEFSLRGSMYVCVGWGGGEMEEILITMGTRSVTLLGHMDPPAPWRAPSARRDLPW